MILLRNIRYLCIPVMLLALSAFFIYKHSIKPQKIDLPPIQYKLGIEKPLTIDSRNNNSSNYEIEVPENGYYILEGQSIAYKQENNKDYDHNSLDSAWHSLQVSSDNFSFNTADMESTKQPIYLKKFDKLRFSFKNPGLTYHNYVNVYLKAEVLLKNVLSPKTYISRFSKADYSLPYIQGKSGTIFAVGQFFEEDPKEIVQVDIFQNDVKLGGFLYPFDFEEFKASQGHIKYLFGGKIKIVGTNGNNSDNEIYFFDNFVLKFKAAEIDFWVFANVPEKCIFSPSMDLEINGKRGQQLPAPFMTDAEEYKSPFWVDSGDVISIDNINSKFLVSTNGQDWENLSYRNNVIFSEPGFVIFKSIDSNILSDIDITHKKNWTFELSANAEFPTRIQVNSGDCLKFCPGGCSSNRGERYYLNGNLMPREAETQCFNADENLVFAGSIKDTSLDISVVSRQGY